MRLTPFRLALVLGTALAAAPACLAQNPPDAATPDVTAPIPDPMQIEPAPPPDQTQAPAPTAAPPTPLPAPTPPPAAAVPPAPTPAPAATPPAAQPEAKPADPIANVLGPEVRVLGYSIRPPKDYTSFAVPAQRRGRRDFIWQGAIHQDKYVTTIGVSVSGLETRTADPDRAFMVDFYKSMTVALSDVVISPSQPVMVGGMHAIRATWTGKLATKTTRLTIQGFVYAIRDGSIRLSVTGVDSSPYFATTFPAMNASALSLHK